MSEGITDIEWSVYGKILQITKTNEDIQFKYDASGNRVEKIVKPKVLGLEQSQEYWVYTYYMRDAQGNVMAVYNRNIGIASGQVTDQLFLQETSIYGSSRLGLADQSSERSAFTPGTLSSFVSYNLDGTINRTGSSALTTGTYVPHNTLGFKRYELSNHLGNVNVVIADRKIAVDDGSFTASGIVDRYLPDVLSSQDYYAFGAVMPGRSFVGSASYRYGFGSMEKDEEVKGDGNHYTTENRQYDPRLGRWFSLDPAARSNISMYAAFSNNPIIKTDPRGDDDFFDKNGKLLYSTSVGNTIHVVNVSKEAFYNALLIGTPIITAKLKGAEAQGDAMNHFLESYSAPLASLNFNYQNVENYNTAYGIGQYYYSLEGFKEKDAVGGATYEGGAIGVTSERIGGLPISENPNAIYMAVDPATDKISPLLNDKYNLMNLWAHERSHWTGESTWPAFSTSEVEYGNHLKAFWAQINHWTWSRTTEEWKDSQIKIIGSYLLYLNDDTRKEAQAKFEKQLDIKFTKLELNSGSGDNLFNIEYESNKH